MEQGCKNTETEIWRESPGDYYSDSVAHDKGSIVIKAGGTCVGKTCRGWIEQAECIEALEAGLKERDAEMAILSTPKTWVDQNEDGFGAPLGSQGTLMMRECRFCKVRWSHRDDGHPKNDCPLYNLSAAAKELLEKTKEFDKLAADYDVSYTDNDYKVIRAAVEKFSLRNTKLEAKRDRLREDITRIVKGIPEMLVGGGTGKNHFHVQENPALKIIADELTDALATKGV